MKKILILVCLLVLVLAGCGGKKDEASQPKGEKISGSIEDLMAKNKTFRCELIAKEGEDIISGTTYVAGTRARSDFKNKMGEQVVTGHMINDGNWLYTWTEEYPDQAVKMKMEDLQELSQQPEADKANAEYYEEKLDYDCYNWVKDESVFNLPANVKFIDFTEMMKSLQGLMDNLGSEGGTPNLQNVDTSSMCSACNAITDAASKASCLSSLGCK